MIARIHSTTIAVADQDAALDFYVNTLGWTKVLDAEFGEGMRFLTVVPPEGGAELVLGHKSWAGEQTGQSGHTGISLTTHNLDETYQQLTERGVKFKEPPATMPWGQKATWFTDIDGNEFFLVEE